MICYGNFNPRTPQEHLDRLQGMDYWKMEVRHAVAGGFLMTCIGLAVVERNVPSPHQNRHTVHPQTFPVSGELADLVCEHLPDVERCRREPATNFTAQTVELRMPHSGESFTNTVAGRQLVEEAEAHSDSKQLLRLQSTAA